MLLQIAQCSSFLRLNSISLCVCVYIYTSHCIHSLVLGCFLALATVNNAAVNTVVQLFPQDSDLVSCGYIPRNGKAGSYGSSTVNY